MQFGNSLGLKDVKCVFFFCQWRLAFTHTSFQKKSIYWALNYWAKYFSTQISCSHGPYIQLMGRTEQTIKWINIYYITAKNYRKKNKAWWWGPWDCCFIILFREGFSEQESEQIEGMSHKNIWVKIISGLILYLVMYFTSVWTSERTCYTCLKKKNSKLGFRPSSYRILDSCLRLPRDFHLLDVPSLNCPKDTSIFPTSFHSGVISSKKPR